jgi:hypothetical protein
MQPVMTTEGKPLKEYVEAFERMLIDNTMRRHKGSIAAVMDELCLPRRTLNEKMAKYGLLQEVIRAPVPSPEWLIYEDAHRRLDQRGDLFADVSARLPQHQAFFAPAARGPLTDEQGRRYTSEHGLGAWVARDLLSRTTPRGLCTGSYRPDGWGPEPVPRTMQMMRLQGEGWAQGWSRRNSTACATPVARGTRPQGSGRPMP